MARRRLARRQLKKPADWNGTTSKNNNIYDSIHANIKLLFFSHSFNSFSSLSHCVRYLIMPSSKPQPSSPPRTWTTTLTILTVVIALLSALFYYLDSHLEWFYIFSPDQLHDLAQRAIGAHGNDTKKVVEFIVGELSEILPGGYVNLDEEWIFNNAGGAMGAMYIIHASKCLPLAVNEASSSPCHMIITQHR
jgi:hypothetical protein